MSQGKFASITSALLARKGEAAPWHENGRLPLAWRSDGAPAMVEARKMPSPPPPPPTTPALKRCTVRLSQDEYERLGLMAVKKDITRQQLLQAALAEVLAGMARDFTQSCACIGKACAEVCSDKM
jgi:hypothetical protein